MTEAFDNAMLELDGIRVGSWRWLSKWRRAERASVELFISTVLQEANSEEEEES